MPLESIKESFGFYMSCLFVTNKDNSSESGLVNIRHMMIKGLNSIFFVAMKETDSSIKKIMLFSKYCFEESLVFLFAQIQKVFSTPSVIENQDQSYTQSICETIKFVSNTYLCSSSEQKEVIIDPVIKLLLGIIMGMQEHNIQRTKAVLSIINATGDALYNMIMKSDQNLAKGYISSSLNEAQKSMLQNVIKAIATTKKAQEGKDMKPKNTQATGQQKDSNVKGKETQSKIKLATRIGK